MEEPESVEPKSVEVPWADRVAEQVAEWRANARVVVGVVLCLALAAGVAWWRASTSTGPPPAVEVPAGGVIAGVTSVPGTTVGTTPAPLVVHVVGAVHRVGVVRVPPGARIADVIAAAGGATARADLTRLNLAAVVEDASRVAVPEQGQPPPPLDPAPVSSGGAGAATGGADDPGGPLNVNTASAEELEALPGVGPATAAAIVEEREAHGPFGSPDDLERVRGIGPAKLAAIRDLVTV
jgi:competence protein ComEA